jgi:Thioredoxin-like
VRNALIIAAAFLAIGSAATAADAQDTMIAAGDAADIVTQEMLNPAAFDASRNASADVDAALMAARASGKHVLIIMGGSWCHDSMALWDQFHTPRTAAMLAARYEIAWVDVGYRDRNLHIARRFGLTGIDGTPTVLILRPDGTAANLEDAPRWRNAASRKPAAIYRTFERAAPAIITQ